MDEMPILLLDGPIDVFGSQLFFKDYGPQFNHFLLRVFGEPTRSWVL